MNKTETRQNIMTYPFEVVVCALALISIIRVIKVLPHLDSLPDEVRQGLLTMSPVLLWIWMIMGGVGASLMLIGLSMSSFRWVGRLVESVGCWLSFGMWTSIGAADVIYFPHDWLAYVQYFLIGAACLVRILALSRVKTAVIRARREARR